MRLLDRLLGPDRLRRRALDQVQDGPLHDLLAEPWPDTRARCRDTELVALDIEATGLDRQRDHILSIGMVTVRHMGIELSGAQHLLIHTDAPLPADSVIIHGITDDDARQGMALSDALPIVLERLSGRVLLAHHAWVELGFLSTACERLYGAPLVIPTIDTQALAQRLMRNRNQFVASTSLRLFNLRGYYGLPRYRAHNALSDALATAELFLALAADIQPDGDLRLGQVLMH